MIQYPRLKYHYHARFFDNDNGKVLLSSESDSVLLSGKPYCLILEAIQNEGISLDDLMTRFGSQLSEMEVLWVLNVLESKGYITESAPELQDETNAFWNSGNIDGKRLSKILAEESVTLEIIDSPREATEAFMEAFSEMGIQTNRNGGLRVIVMDDYRSHLLEAVNNAALAASQPWLLVKPVGAEIWLGPLFIPGQTGCWECLNHRLTINNPFNTFFQSQKNSKENLTAPRAYVPASLRTAAELTALEVVKYLYHKKNERLEGQLISIDLHTLSNREHKLLRRPQCPVCGTPLDKNRTPEALSIQKRTSFCVSTAGGYRELSPEDTLEKYRHHISPITGIVRTLKPYYYSKGEPVYNITSGPNTALQSKSLYWLNSHIRSANGGKGKSWSQAKAGALCEAVERFSMTYQGDESCITATMDQLGEKGIHPNRCMNFSQSQYQNRESINQDCSRLFNLVPASFDPLISTPMEWSPVYSLTHNQFKYLPTAFCYTQYPSQDESQLFSYPDSNGCAAGNSLEEAMLQGFLELVERDSVAIWWYNQLERPGVDLERFQQPYFQQLMRYYRSKNRGLHVLDITGDLGIPTFAAISYRLDSAKENIIFGFGAHVDATLAIERSLVELNQLMPIADAPGTQWEKGKYLTDEKNFVHWLETATLENKPYMAPSKTLPQRQSDDYPALCPIDIHDSLNYCLEQATKNRLETLVLDMTRIDIGLPVVRVFIPGMRHFWRRLAPGRLYEVPVKMGWSKNPLQENQLNPIGLFI